MEKHRKKISGIVFLIFIFGFLFSYIVTPNIAFSTEEKRELQQLEAPTIETLTNGEWFADFTKFCDDQFSLRTQMRFLNAVFRTEVLQQNDIGGIYTEDGYIFKSDYPVNDKYIQNFIDKTNEVYELYIKDKADNYYVSVVPDKTYFDSGNHLTNDANYIANTFANGLIDASYIDIFNGLSLDCYYKTDTHWTQNKLFDVMKIFGDEMRFNAPVKEDFTENLIEGFYGVYHGQSALNFPTDDLIYMTNPIINSAILNNIETGQSLGVYNLDKFNSSDSYNVFSDGAAALVVIESPNATSDKELIIFRDSFGSSIAPLFLEEYSKVTLVDMRYMAASLLPQYVDFEGSDVLVLYSTLILNSSIILK